MLFKVIMEGFNNSFGSGFKGQGRFCHCESMITGYPRNIQMCVEGTVWIGNPIHLSRVENSLCSDIILGMKLGNQTCWSDFVAKFEMFCFGILYPFTIMSIIFQNFKPKFMKILINKRQSKILETSSDVPLIFPTVSYLFPIRKKAQVSLSMQICPPPRLTLGISNIDLILASVAKLSRRGRISSHTPLWTLVNPWSRPPLSLICVLYIIFKLCSL